ncbi:nickel transporter [Alsobacter soli]|uniref:Nickel/cobalt efflux system n=1 Tax=Alsobacter soli TaxID=2109933 RepID=A0A2T1HLM1_9HYPH|nr:nickel/cobalt transporter [Alsobacter soli]PSC02550.1 nickel transporter [Alsobacter soli]
MSVRETVSVAAAPPWAEFKSCDRRRLLLSIAIALGAVGLVGLVGLLLTWAVGGMASAAPAPKNPFGVGVREAGAPGNALAAWILGTQAAFYHQLTAAIRDLKANGSAGWSLAAISFAYGVFHAAGPGHGKAVISAWIVGNERALRRGLAMAFAAAGVQALVAIALVTVLSGLLRLTALRMTSVTGAVEMTSFAAVALIGAALTWRKARALASRVLPNGSSPAHAPHEGCSPGCEVSNLVVSGSRSQGPEGTVRSVVACEACGPDCGHVHLPGPERASAGWREAAGAVLAAGIRPCSGAIIVLVFAMAQGLYLAGIGATLAMGFGTAVTTGALAALAVFAKGAALRLASGRGGAEWLVATMEVLAGAFVFALGLALAMGVTTAGSV